MVSTLRQLVMRRAVPLMFQGGEVLETRDFSFPTPPTLDIVAMKSSNPGWFQWYRDWIALRTNQGGNTRGLTGNNSYYIQHPGSNVIAGRFWDQGGAGDETFVITNNSNNNYQGYVIGFQQPGVYRLVHNSDARMYGADFGAGDVPELLEVRADSPGHDGLSHSATLPRVPPYSGLIYSLVEPR
jgi:1,4-alpha-glucan branching enzyme